MTVPEKAVADAGWLLYGPVHSQSGTTVLLAMSSADGMCRPMGFQAFVFSKGRFAGTVSPRPMDSRADGSLSEVRLPAPDRIEAAFARYSGSDPLCCPSRLSTVYYTFRGRIPVVTAIRVKTAATQTGERAESGRSEALLSLNEWTLTAIGGRPWNAPTPDLTFDTRTHRLSGDTGCNSFSGAFSIAGDSLSVSSLSSTRRACLSPDANQVEAQFLRALESVTRFAIEGQKLHLYAGERPVLEFTGK